MATILPRFDFAVDATPTRDTLIEQALSLEITGLDLADLDESFLPILSGGDSGTTGAIRDQTTSIGTLWADKAGNVWVQEKSGPVMLYRFHGGWESRRYFVIPATSGPDPILPGMGVAHHVGGPNETYDRTYTATDPTDNDVIWHYDDEGMDTNDSGRINGIAQETMASEFRRWSGRGLTILRDTSTGVQVTIASMRRNYRMFNNDTGQNFRKQSYHGFDLATTRWQGYILAPAANSSVASQSSDNHNIHLNFMAWNFGVQLLCKEAHD